MASDQTLFAAPSSTDFHCRSIGTRVSPNDSESEDMSDLSFQSVPQAQFMRPKRRRTSTEQLLILTKIFEQTDTPNYELRQELSKRIGMSAREIQVWFQNRRAKINRSKHITHSNTAHRLSFMNMSSVPTQMPTVHRHSMPDLRRGSAGNLALPQLQATPPLRLPPLGVSPNLNKLPLYSSKFLPDLVPRGLTPESTAEKRAFAPEGKPVALEPTLVEERKTWRPW